MTSKASISFEGEDRVTRVINGIKSSITGLDQRAATLAGSFAKIGALGGIFGGAGVLLAVRDTVSALDDLADTAPGIGLAATELSAFQISARAAGVSAEELTGGLARFSKVLEEGRSGNAAALETLRALGIGRKELASGQLTTADAFKRAADAVSGYRDGFEKTALVQEAFGRGGAKFVALLNEGTAGLTKFGGASAKAIEDASKLQGKIDTLAASWERFKFAVAGGVASLFPGADYTGEELPDQLDRLNATAARLRKQILSTGEPTIAGDLTIALEGVEDEARRVEARIKALMLAASEPAQPKSAPSVRDPEAAARAAKAAKEGADAFRKYQEELQRNALAAANAEQAYIKLEEAIDAKMWDDYIAGVRKAADEEAALTQSVLELSGVLEEQRKIAQRQKLDELVRAGVLTPEQAERAVKGIAGIRDEIDQTTDSSERFAIVFSSSIGRLIDTGGTLKDFFASLAQDIAKLIIQLTVLEPLAAKIKELFKAGGGGGGLGSVFGSLFGAIAGGGSVAPAPAGAVGKQSSGMTVNITNNIGAAYGDAGLAKALEANRRATIAQLSDMQARGRMAMG